MCVCVCPHPSLLGVQCIPQRAALLKSMLNFLKKAIQDPAFSDGIRHGERPRCPQPLVTARGGTSPPHPFSSLMSPPK